MIDRNARQDCAADRGHVVRHGRRRVIPDAVVPNYDFTALTEKIMKTRLVTLMLGLLALGGAARASTAQQSSVPATGSRDMEHLGLRVPVP